MHIHRIDILFEEVDLTPHVSGEKMMVLREQDVPDPRAFVIPSYYIDATGKEVTPENAVAPGVSQLEDQVKSIVQVCSKSAPDHLYIHLVQRTDLPWAIGLCAHDKPLEKWSFKDFGLPGLQVATEQRFINGKKFSDF